MKVVQITDHMTFPIEGSEGKYEVDVFYSADWRVTEICIAGEDGATVTEGIVHMAMTAATMFGTAAKSPHWPRPIPDDPNPDGGADG
jgi:hypothetical protein